MTLYEIRSTNNGKCHVLERLQQSFRCWLIRALFRISCIQPGNLSLLLEEILTNNTFKQGQNAQRNGQQVAQTNPMIISLNIHAREEYFSSYLIHSFEQMNQWLYHVMWKAGYGFSPDGKGLNITPMLPRLLRNAGYQAVQQVAHTLDFSAETDGWVDFYRNAEVGYYMAMPIFITTGVATQKEVERVYQQMLIDMHAADFAGMWHFVTAWGTKP